MRIIIWFKTCLVVSSSPFLAQSGHILIYKDDAVPLSQQWATRTIDPGHRNYVQIDMIFTGSEITSPLLRH